MFINSLKNFAFSFLVVVSFKVYSQDFQNLTLQQAMNFAEQNSLILKKSQSSLSLAQKSETLSYFSMAPMATATGNYSAYPSDAGDGINAGINQNNGTTLDFHLTQPLSGLGQSVYKVRQAKESQNAAENDFLAARIQSRLNAAENYLKAEETLQTCKIYKANVIKTKKQYEETQVLFETGEADKTKVDLLKTLATYLKSQNDVAKCDLDFQSAISDLKNTLGERTKNQFSIQDDAMQNFEKIQIKLPPLDSFLENISNKKPEIQSLQNQIKAISNQQIQNSFNYFPELSFVADYMHSSSQDFAQTINTTYTPFSQKTFYYGLNVTWNIWDGGVTTQNTFNYTQQKENYKIQKEEAERNAQSAIEKSYRSIETYLSILKTSNHILQTNEEAYKLSFIQYKIGVMSAADLVLLQNDLTNSQIEVVKNKMNVALSWLQLQAAAGMLPSI